jgi:23S rRNA pseudouridine2605 synthase
MAKQRLQKLLAQSGVASRRAAERMIADGRVRLNGRVVRELGTRADLHDDKLEVDGRRIVAEKPAYYLLHKPRGVVTTMADPEGRPTVAELVARVPERVVPVGRLDFNTSGALLLTNDGAMSQALLHPRKHVPKTYICKLQGKLPIPALQAMREGVTLDGGERTGKADVIVLREEGGHTWLRITLHEGKNRQVHRMAEAVGQRVMRLSRESFAGLSTEDLRPGELRPLTAREIFKLERDYKSPSQQQEHVRVRDARRAAAGHELELPADAPDDDDNEPTVPAGARGPGRGPRRGPARPPAREPARPPARGPARGPSRARPPTPTPSGTKRRVKRAKRSR